ncbi:hypothetical protein INH39_11060 [Massilia violaceinigra]|uniref:Uncharacterized protein n=1 Tax=Massilia violaceinigra TaxID=2045208 RepID=A0ABY4ADY8_9BURK|nr:hypothetical protein [Massilia violaceinigra]UOD32154.1 hypothetical protein INH39_11060 [Massilia violaceinigra]
MNIFDFITTNLFLSNLFPQGLEGDVLLGQLSFSVKGQMALNIHTQQKPAIETAKWGTWGEDYNVIVLQLSGHGGRYLHMENWWHADFAPVNRIEENGIWMLTQRGDNWSIKMDLDDLILQRCSTYLI